MRVPLVYIVYIVDARNISANPSGDRRNEFPVITTARAATPKTGFPSSASRNRNVEI